MFRGNAYNQVQRMNRSERADAGDEVTCKAAFRNRVQLWHKAELRTTIPNGSRSQGRDTRCDDV